MVKRMNDSQASDNVVDFPVESPIPLNTPKRKLSDAMAKLRREHDKIKKQFINAGLDVGMMVDFYNDYGDEVVSLFESMEDE